jgi:hypothetical protein
MKKWFLLLYIMVFWIVGCAGHFYRIEKGKVTFYLELSAARRVEFAYSLDEYKLRMVKKKGTGTWEISVPADLEFGYFFMVDGVVYLPECQYREADDFGSENCIFVPRP